MTDDSFIQELFLFTRLLLILKILRKWSFKSYTMSAIRLTYEHNKLENS